MSNEIIWTSTEAVAVTGGRCAVNWYATGVSINMQDLKPGDLYIATQEDDLNEVLRRGAAAAVVSSGGHRMVEGLPLLEVGSVFEALQDLARAARFKTHAHIIAVQGRIARTHMQRILGHAGSVHTGGRHLSMGMASLPEDVDYGLFGSSPAVQPDIAVISNAAAANRDTLFETMPISGTVLIHADDEVFLSVVARAKAAGIQNIFTYGMHEQADARIVSSVSAGNGTRLSVRILDEEHSVTLQSGETVCASFAAGLLVLKLTGRSLARAVKALESSVIHSAAPENNVSLIDPAVPQGPAQSQAVFKVTNMIDFGSGRQTAVLENFANFSQNALCFPKADLSIPRHIDTLDFMYTSKRFGTVRNAHEALRQNYKNAKLETIAPQALVPGDFIVFKDIRSRSKAVFSEALRLIPNLKPKKIRTSHAV